MVLNVPFNRDQFATGSSAWYSQTPWKGRQPLRRRGRRKRRKL